MKYINASTEQLDKEIEKMFELSLPTSAFKRVIPTQVKEELRSQYVEYLNEKKLNEQTVNGNNGISRPVSTQVIKVNISSLREAGYCCCPQQLASACEELLKTHSTVPQKEEICEMKSLTENVHTIGKNNSSETAECDVEFDTETTNPKSEDSSSEVHSTDSIVVANQTKTFPTKLSNGEEFSKKTKSAKNQSRTTKRKYFTKYMSNEFRKDTKPVNMEMMDSKTQLLFQEKDFNELVSEITGIN